MGAYRLAGPKSEGVWACRGLCTCLSLCELHLNGEPLYPRAVAWTGRLRRSVKDVS